MSVYRRFSDFLGLHDKLVESHLHEGFVIPPPPEKSVVGEELQHIILNFSWLMVKTDYLSSLTRYDKN